MVWIPEHGALVPGDRILGGAARRPPGLPRLVARLPQGRTDPAGLRAELRKLLELPIRMVLVSHGEPVLRDAKRKLGRAVA